MCSMRILITGATGFVGQNLMPMLVDKCPEAEILVLCRNVDKAHALFLIYQSYLKRQKIGIVLKPSILR